MKKRLSIQTRDSEDFLEADKNPNKIINAFDPAHTLDHEEETEHSNKGLRGFLRGR